jgi:hypothetical protein
VKIEIDQPITASVQEAQAALLDADFYKSLGKLEGISAPEVRSLSTDGTHARAVLGYRFSGQLNGVARAMLDPAKLTWAQVSEVDLEARKTEVEMVPDNYASLLSFSGWYELRDAGEGRCCQHFEGELRVHVPVVGALAEHAIAGSIRENFANTARLLEEFIATRRPS